MGVERILTLGEAKARRLAVKHELRDLGYSKAFVEQIYQRMVRHDQLRRASAIVQALQFYRPAATRSAFRGEEEPLALTASEGTPPPVGRNLLQMELTYG